MILFFGYLYSKLKTVFCLAVFATIFYVVFALYRLPVSAVAYASLLVLFFLFIFGLLDFESYKRKYEQIKRLNNSITVSDAFLPEPSDLIEHEYVEVIKTIYADKTEIMSDMSQKYSDIIDYYTIWAHQIKTPIAAMHLIIQSEDIPNSRELSAELQRIEQYVEMVLGYVRLESDNTDYVIRKYDLDGIVKQAARKYASQFIRKKIKLEYEPIDCEVLTDEKWLLFVIEQIISNSLKYTQKGTITIKLEEKKTLVISDTGLGIAPDDLPRVFDKGYTGYNGRTDKRASGIGLYLCKRILTRLGHSIEIESKPGVGTSVRICLESVDLEVE